jgi:cytochrome c biogenesis protein CcmG, thiol:disulfide interchange protein DsbE
VTEEHRQAGLTVLAINIKESRETAAAWVKQRGITARVLLDPDGAVTRAYRVGYTPTVVLVGRDGAIVARASGTRDWSKETGRALFRLLLAAPAR